MDIPSAGYEGSKPDIIDSQSGQQPLIEYAAHRNATLCLEAFTDVQRSLKSTVSDLRALVPMTSLEDQLGRFRVWCANIGALQKGHSSLDYRLREVPLIHQNILKLLSDIQKNLHQIALVLSGTRLPYEQQTRAESRPSESSSSSSSSSTEELSTSGDSDVGSTELEQRFSNTADIIDTLYKMSRYIRAPAIDSRNLKGSSFRKVDKDSGIDLFSDSLVEDKTTGRAVKSLLPDLDLSFVIDYVCQLRLPPSTTERFFHQIDDMAPNSLNPFLEDILVAEIREEDIVRRLAQSNTRRRQQFQYWERHRDKLGFKADIHETREHSLTQTIAALDVNLSGLVPVEPKILPQVGETVRGDHPVAPTIPSQTTATDVGALPSHFEDLQSVTSVASTSYGEDGVKVALPSLPKGVHPGKDFECPYCFIICPGKYQNPRNWRSHLFRDLRPYLCTYTNCLDPKLRFATRDQWFNHEEQTHRKIWQCPEHLSHKFKSKAEFEIHIQTAEHQAISNHDFGTISNSCQTVEQDARRNCFLCHVDFPDARKRRKHEAFHMERIAAFSLPRDVDLDDDNQSFISSKSSISVQSESGDSSGGSPSVEKWIPRFTEMGDPWADLLSLATETLRIMNLPSRNAYRVSLRAKKGFTVVVTDLNLMCSALASCPYCPEASPEVNQATEAARDLLSELRHPRRSNDIHDTPTEYSQDGTARSGVEEGLKRKHIVFTKLINLVRSYSYNSHQRLVVAIAGTGYLAQKFAYEISKTDHLCVFLSRSARPFYIPQTTPVVEFLDYGNESKLIDVLTGFDVIISTIPKSAQMPLIRAASEAHVRRFVLSEFEGKFSSRNYDTSEKQLNGILRFSITDISNSEESSMEFTVFTCGVFYERFLTGGLSSFQIGRNSRTALQQPYIVDGEKGTAQRLTHRRKHISICMTSTEDLAQAVASMLKVDLADWGKEICLMGDKNTIEEVIESVSSYREMGDDGLLSCELLEANELEHRLEQAQNVGDFDTAARLRELIVTRDGRYEFDQDINLPIPFHPMAFRMWLHTHRMFAEKVTASEKPVSPGADSDAGHNDASEDPLGLASEYAYFRRTGKDFWDGIP